MSIARILLGSHSHLRVLLQHLLKEAGNLGDFPLVIGLDAGKRIEEDRRRPSEEAFALTLVTSLCLDHVVLADAARGPTRLAHDNVAEPDIVVLVRSSDAAAYADQKTNTDGWQRGKQARGGGSSRDGSVESGGQRGNDDIVFPHATPRINVRVGLVPSEADWSYMLLVEHGFCSGPLNGKSGDPGDRIGVGVVESVVGCHGVERSVQRRQICVWKDRVVQFALVDKQPL